MSDIENAIRQKLSQVDINDASARSHVYETIWNAHEQYLISNTSISDEDRTRRRNNLTTLIKNIEQSFHITSPHITQNSPQASQSASLSNNTHYSTQSAQGTQNDASLNLSAIHPDTNRAFQTPEKRSKRRGLLFLSIIILLIIAGAGWFYVNHFLNNSSSTEYQTSNAQTNTPSHTSEVQDPPVAQSVQTQQNIERAADNQSAPRLQTQRPPQEETRPLSQDLRSDDDKRSDDGWIRVFTPQDVVGLEVKGAAKAQIVNTDGDSYVRISSQSINDAAVINIGNGALNQLRGHTITVDILARSNTSKPSQLIVTCDFGGNVECGRIRFEVPATRDDLLFNVTLPAKSSGPGKIYLTSDYSKKDQSIDIYRVFIRKND